MNRPVVALTGAHSYLGRCAVRTLKEDGRYEIVSFVSPEGDAAGLEGTTVIRADLCRPLPAEAVKALSGAHRVIHFAWVRGRRPDEVNQKNEAMIRSLIDPLSDPGRFVFISSVAGCPGALSTYGTAKALATQLVLGLGGTALLCGLVVDAVPKGPYKMLCSAVGKLPLAIRLGRGEPKVLPIHLNDVGKGVKTFCDRDLEPAAYGLFSDVVGFNDFMALLETLYKRRRIRWSLNADVILKTAHLLKRARLAPHSLCDKILTFLYKDEDYLTSRKKIPDLALRPFGRGLLEKGGETV